MVSYKFPIIGSTREYRKDPRAFLEKYEAKYGPVYRAHLFGRICTVVSDQYVREVFLNNNFNFEKAFNGVSLSSIFYSPILSYVISRLLMCTLLRTSRMTISLWMRAATLCRNI
ncbi:hypothetical protein BCR43DRAFT_485148 [Syncephalastrum racemosum]|uniref:Cytochrome P450 n=1 Tax=Syncephalastrum racemosum TaxID=13706 RepID=A0A1X2HM19_SYNRA|nr:hypothetical protein BCR43DRAFT_485148 [Syncephalastrum racemosum]